MKDPSGSLVPKAIVELTNTGTGAARSAVSNLNGSYEFVNVDVGNYKVTIEATGFHKSEFDAFDLSARETRRLDVNLQVATQATTVNVEATSILQTDVSNVAETKGSRELIDLPVAITTRAGGSTSAFSTLSAANQACRLIPAVISRWPVQRLARFQSASMASVQWAPAPLVP